MLNALWFKPNGGAERYAEYGAAVLPILEAVGADLLFPFLPVERALEGGLDADVVGFVRYPSRESFEAMFRGEAYQKISHLRETALEKAVLTRCSIDPPDGRPLGKLAPGVLILNALWFVPGGAALYEEYLSEAEPMVAARGGRLLSPRLRPEESLAEPFTPSLILLGHYPSAEAIFDLVSSPEYLTAARVRARALVQSATTMLRVSA
jgi:uncharacterized protein (DUF1330 family)